MDAEITRSETTERARLLRIRSYDVDLDFTRGPQTFGSTSLIRFDCRRPGTTTHADLIASGVREITLNGAPLDPTAVWADGRITLSGLADRNELRVVADCAYTSTGTGLHRTDSADGSVHIYAKLAQAYARTAYACFDQPDLKSAFTFRVTAPAGWVVLSNQPQADIERTVDDSQTVRFLPTPPLPTFTTTVVAGDYHLVRAEHTTPDGQRIPLELACRADLAESLDAEALFELTANGLDFYTGWLSAAYPYAKYGQVFVPELSCLASEDAGCVLVSEQLLFRSQNASPTQLRSRTGTVLHEMAHMWFGDCATQQWWDDLWLSKSFADFCEATAQVALGLDPDAWSTMSVLERIGAFADDQLPSAHPVASGAATVSEAIATFDGISYAKGAAALRQLSASVGEETFTTGLRAYLAGHSYGNARLADLLAAVGEAAGKDLTPWSKAWLETAGPNVLRAEFSTDPSGRFTEFSVVQQASERHPALRPHRVAVGLYRRSGGSLERVGRVDVDVTGERTAVPSLRGALQPDLILLNDDDTGYVLVRFDPRSLSTVLSSVGGLPDLAARAVCWTAVIDMVRQAELPVTGFAAMLAGAMRSEPSQPVLDALIDQAEWLIARFATPSQAAEARTLLESAAAEIPSRANIPGRANTPGRADIPDRPNTPERANTPGSANTPGRPNTPERANTPGSAQAPGHATDGKPRWAALWRLALAGQADDARIDAALAADPSDTGRRSAAACRAAIPDAAHKEAAWRLLTSDRTGPETVTAVAGGLMQPEHADLLAPYTERYLAEMPGLWRTRDGHMRVRLANALFPYPAVTAAFLTRIDEFLNTGAVDPGLARVVLDHRDTAERVLRARARLIPGDRAVCPGERRSAPETKGF